MPKYLASVYFWRTENVFIDGIDEDDAEEKVHELFAYPDTDVQDVSLQLVSGDDEEEQE